MSHTPAQIGSRAQLRVLKKSAPGFFLDSGGELGNILLPHSEVHGSCEVDGQVDVFIYCDSEDRPVATMKRPIAMPGEFACLKCVSVTPIGSFLDWGLAKDLFIPFREQNSRLEVDKSYVVFVYVDPESDRIVDAVSHDGDDLASGLQVSHELTFRLGRGLADDVAVVDDSGSKDRPRIDAAPGFVVYAVYLLIRIHGSRPRQKDDRQGRNRFTTPAQG